MGSESATHSFPADSDSVAPRRSLPLPALSSTLPSWRELLQSERSQPYFKELLSFVERERLAGKEIYPPNAHVFEALHRCPFDSLKVVIIGQDPYFNPGQAHGLCFSVKRGVAAPPSLLNIFKEIESDLGTPVFKEGPSIPARHGELTSWADQGVLLLNAILTVERGKPLSHAQRGWERFTDSVVEAINSDHRGIVFLLWGSPAQKKGAAIDRARHHVLTAPHPSPLSAHRGFLGCRHFSKCNALLAEMGRAPIDWQLPG